MAPENAFLNGFRNSEPKYSSQAKKIIFFGRMVSEMRDINIKNDCIDFRNVLDPGPCEKKIVPGT